MKLKQKIEDILSRHGTNMHFAKNHVPEDDMNILFWTLLRVGKSPHLNVYPPLFWYMTNGKGAPDTPQMKTDSHASEADIFAAFTALAPHVNDSPLSLERARNAFNAIADEKYAEKATKTMEAMQAGIKANGENIDLASLKLPINTAAAAPYFPMMPFTKEQCLEEYQNIMGKVLLNENRDVWMATEWDKDGWGVKYTIGEYGGEGQFNELMQQKFGTVIPRFEPFAEVSVVFDHTDSNQAEVDINDMSIRHFLQKRGCVMVIAVMQGMCHRPNLMIHGAKGVTELVAAANILRAARQCEYDKTFVRAGGFSTETYTPTIFYGACPVEVRKDPTKDAIIMTAIHAPGDNWTLPGNTGLAGLIDQYQQFGKVNEENLAAFREQASKKEQNVHFLGEGGKK